MPFWKSIVRYAKNYTVQKTDLAAAVSATRRAFLEKEWREESDEDAAVKTAHLLADELIEDSLLAEADDAQDEAVRRLALRKVRRDRLSIVVELDAETRAVDLGDTIGLTHSRIGGTHRYLAIGIETDAAEKRITWIVWGPE